MSEFVHATQGFQLPRDRGDDSKAPIIIGRGDVLRADDPIVKKYPNLFEAHDPAPSVVDERVERATARPGERRDVEIPLGRGETTKAKAKAKTKHGGS